MKKINCPKCGKELIRLEPYNAFKEGLYDFGATIVILTLLLKKIRRMNNE